MNIKPIIKISDLDGDPMLVNTSHILTVTAMGNNRGSHITFVAGGRVTSDWSPQNILDAIEGKQP